MHGGCIQIQVSILSSEIVSVHHTTCYATMFAIAARSRVTSNTKVCLLLCVYLFMLSSYERRLIYEVLSKATPSRTLVSGHNKADKRMLVGD